MLALQTDYGELKVVFEPPGTRGHDDLRRPQVAAPGDLVRILEALGHEQGCPQDRDKCSRVVELERSRVVELERGITNER